MKPTVVALSLATLAFTSPVAHADECAASFPDRLADAKRAVSERLDYLEKNKAQLAAVDWFADHCRFLNKLELAVRKLDDPNAFVCDTAKGRPKGLTAELVAEFSAVPLVTHFQSGEQRAANYACWERDKAERIPLVALETLTPTETLEFLCYGDERPRCVQAREVIAAARGKGIK